MEQLPKGVHERLAAAQGADVSAHPDADTLNAFAENALLAPERERILNHLAGCSDCRDIVALALPQEVAAAKTASIDIARGAVPFRWKLFRWAGVAAAVVVMAAVGWLYRSKTIEEPEVEVASPPVVAPPGVSTQPAQGSVQTAPGTVPVASPHQKTDTFARSENITVSKSARTTVAPKKVETGGSTRHEAIDVSSEAPIVASEANRQNVIGGILAQPKPQVELLPPPLYEAKGGPRMKAAQAAATPDTTSRRRAEDSTFVRTYSSTDNDATSLPRGSASANAASTPNVATPASADAALNKPANKRALAKVPAAGAVAQSASQAEVRNLVVESAAPQAAMALARNVAWRISDTGIVERSIRNGVWQSATPASNIQFRTVASAGLDVWAGGMDGALYCSKDAGNSWARMNPSASGQKLTGDVVRIELRNAREVDVIASNGQTWTTHDGGKTWQVR